MAFSSKHTSHFMSKSVKLRRKNEIFQAFFFQSLVYKKREGTPTDAEERQQSAKSDAHSYKCKQSVLPDLALPKNANEGDFSEGATRSPNRQFW